MAEATPYNSDVALAAGYGEKAMTMMRQLAIAATPKHYAIFFAIAAGQPGELVKEFNVLLQQKKPFTDDVLDHLYSTHLAELPSRVVQETVSNARKILAEMVQSVASFSGHTASVGQSMSDQLAKLDGGEITEDDLRLMAKTVIDSAQVMKESSDSMTRKLATAQQEAASLRENLAKATSESERDFLTGCFNRKAFDKRLLEALQAANTDESELSLLMVDIDHFKQFNDNYGHQIGDEVLKIVSRTLTDSVKGMDTVARYGGEEFSVILPKTPIGGGMIVAESIRKSIAGKELRRKNTGETYGVITVSIGVAAFRHHQNDTPNNLIRRADDALYRSKKAGRNRVTQENLSDPVA